MAIWNVHIHCGTCAEFEVNMWLKGSYEEKKRVAQILKERIEACPCCGGDLEVVLYEDC